MDTNNIIYAWLDQNGDPYYVGKTKCLRQRNNDHRKKVNSGNNLPKYNKLRKLLRQGFQWDILILENKIPSEEEMLERECYWIAFYREQGFKLYNLTDGGEGGGGFRFKSEEEKELMIAKMRATNNSKSDEEKSLIRRKKSEAQLRKNANASPIERKKWADARRGRKCSAETKRKISEGNKGKKLSREHRKKLSVARKKRVISDETRRKQSETSTGKINIKKYRCVSPVGVEYITEHGLSEFCRRHGLTPSLMVKVIKRTRDHHKGWKCERLK